MPERVLVVVPVHDEEATLGRCLSAVADAVAELGPGGPATGVVVVLDDCSDASGEVAAAHDVAIVSGRARNVGRARALGVSVGTREDDDGTRTWVVTTDADSVVPRSWLRDHVAAATAGDQALVGRVTPDPDELGGTLLERWRARHTLGEQHVFGANLGVRLSAYRAVGGFRPLRTGEDVALVAALRAAGARVGSGGAPVLTSARLRGRAPDGFADYLSRLSADVLPAPLAPVGAGARPGRSSDSASPAPSAILDQSSGPPGDGRL